MHNRQSDHPLSVYANVEGWVRRTAELGFTGDGMEKVSNQNTPHEMNANVGCRMT